MRRICGGFLSFGMSVYPLMRHNWNPTWFHKLGTHFAVNPDRLPTNPILFNGLGYDGEFYYYSAQDPFLKEKPCECIDSPAYRYGRIGVPFLGYLFSGGNKMMALSWPFLLINFFCMAGLSIVLFDMLEDLNINAIYSVVLCLIPGLTLAYTHSTLECAAVFIVAAGLWCLERGKILWGTCLLGYAGLVRETCLMANISGVLFGQTYTGKKVNRMVFLPGFVTYGLWQLFLISKMGGSSANKSNFAPFLQGYLDVVQSSWPMSQKIIPVVLLSLIIISVPLFAWALIQKTVSLDFFCFRIFSLDPDVPYKFLDLSCQLCFALWVDFFVIGITVRAISCVHSRWTKIFLIISASLSIPLLAITSKMVMPF